MTTFIKQKALWLSDLTRRSQRPHSTRLRPHLRGIGGTGSTSSHCGSWGGRRGQSCSWSGGCSSCRLKVWLPAPRDTAGASAASPSPRTPARTQTAQTHSLKNVFGASLLLLNRTSPKNLSCLPHMLQFEYTIIVLIKIWNRIVWQLASSNKIQTQKGSNECLFILTQTHSMQIFRDFHENLHTVCLYQNK